MGQSEDSINPLELSQDMQMDLCDSVVIGLELFRGHNQKQPFRGVLLKRCSKNMQQIYWRTPMAKCDFNKVAKYGCPPVNLLYIFRTPLSKNTSERLLLS